MVMGWIDPPGLKETSFNFNKGYEKMLENRAYIDTLQKLRAYLSTQGRQENNHIITSLITTLLEIEYQAVKERTLCNERIETDAPLTAKVQDYRIY